MLRVPSAPLALIGQLAADLLFDLVQLTDALDRFESDR
jgi:hypothetical protein